MRWVERLKEKWNIKSGWQFTMIMIVFALTGTTVVLIKRPIVAFFSDGGEQNIWFSIAYFILILPTYNVILLFYGFILGQNEFFWEYEKKMIRRFKRKKKNPSEEDSSSAN
jgi:hypothetical protein